jgi:PAS domain S-box-containing protein
MGGTLKMAPFRDREYLLSPLRIVLLDMVFAGLWIYFTDTLLGTIVRNPDVIVRFSLIKGFLFIAVTSTFLYFLIARDIRRIRAIASAPAESDARFRSSVESSPIAIIVFDADDRCIDYNPAALRLLHLEADTMRGRKTSSPWRRMKPEALRIAAPHLERIALVISGVVMPKMNGRDLMERLRTLKGGPEVRVHFGLHQRYNRPARHLRPGAVLIDKPIDSEVLLRKIRDIPDARADG